MAEKSFVSANHQGIVGGDVDDAPQDVVEAEGIDLTTLSRKELNEVAAGVGVESPEKLPNIDAVIMAIETVETADQENGGDA